jgi:hypothetical protein
VLAIVKCFIIRRKLYVSHIADQVSLILACALEVADVINNSLRLEVG